MKKWTYVISVGGMLAVFMFFYFSHTKEAEIREKARQEEVARQQKEEADRKAAIEEKARQDAERRAAERAAEEKRKEDERIAKWEAAGREIQQSTDEYNAKADAYNKRVGALEIELNQLRTDKEKLNREAFEFAKQVERARVEKRNAEIEHQRLTDIIARRAAESALVRPPTPPTKS
ncbi:MAG: hypothetical protein NVV63_09600 [Opitutus sp.]|nr:hypothetical protein [Opitutus sp.]